jgi:hypothetical protein
MTDLELVAAHYGVTVAQLETALDKAYESVTGCPPQCECPAHDSKMGVI